METVVDALVLYVFLLVAFRISGRRSLAQTTPFDLVLLLVIGQSTQQALVGHDLSLTSAMLAILTLMGSDIALSVVKQRFKRIEALIDDTPLVIVDHGRPLKERMNRERVDEKDVLAAARQLHGLERLEQVKYAVIERSGYISIIPQQPS